MTQPDDTGETRTRIVPTTPIVVSASVLAVTLMGCVTLLVMYDKDASQLVQLITLLFSLGGMASGSGALLYSGTAAHQSRQAAVQTNGSLDLRIEEAVKKALASQSTQGETNA